MHQAMLHASHSNTSLTIWAEAEHRQPTRPEEDNQPPRHPHAIPGKQTRQALLDAGVLSPELKAKTWQSHAHLPSTSQGPTHANDLPSHPGDPVTVTTWLIEGITTTQPHTLTFLLALQRQQEEMQKQDLQIAPDLKFWMNAADFALSLIARQRYLPSFNQGPGVRKPSWVPVITGIDALTFRKMARIMPHAARCINEHRETNRHQTSHASLLDFLTDLIDHQVKEVAAQKMPPPTMGHQQGQPTHSLHDSWLHGLAKEPVRFRRSTDTRQNITHFVEEWHAPLNPRPNPQHRIGFHLLNTSRDDGNLMLVTRLHHLHKDNEATNLRDTWDLSPLPTISPRDISQHRRATLAEMLRAARLSPAIMDGMSNGQIHTFPMSPNDAERFITEDVPRLSEAGFPVTAYQQAPLAPTQRAGAPPLPTRERLQAIPPKTSGKNRPDWNNTPAITDLLQSWWARRMNTEIIHHVSHITMHYAKLLVGQGRIHRIHTKERMVTARVTDTNNRTRRTTLDFGNNPSREQGGIFQTLSQQPLTLALLVEGTMHTSMEHLFQHAGKRLFPRPGLEFQAKCDCNSPLPMCLHAVALHLALSILIDREPSILLELRGVDVTNTILHAANTDGTQVSINLLQYPYSRDPSTFWHGRNPTGQLPVHHPVNLPPYDGILMQQLQVPPDWQGSIDLTKAVMPVYPAASRKAMEMLHTKQASTPPRTDPRDPQPSRESQPRRGIL